MRRDDEFPPSPPVTAPGVKQMPWLGVLGLAAACLGWWWSGALVWAVLLGLSLGLLGASLWWQRDVAQVAGRDVVSMDSAVLASPSATLTMPWSEWISGWYWETNAEGRLCLVQPGLACGDPAETDWDALTALLAQEPVFLDCWTPASATPAGEGAAQPAAAELSRLRFAFTQAQAWSGSLVLPWPAALSMLQGVGAEGARECELRGAPRRGPCGELLGFQGVLSLRPAQPEARPVAAPAIPASDAEQEALRYALSHDLRAPLRVVEGFTRIVKEDYGRFLDRVGHDHLDRVLTASARMNGMIDAILNQAQLAGALVERTEIDFSALAREVGSEMAVLVPTRTPVSLWVADGMQIRADTLLLRRVMENLIGNAMKYSAKVESPRVEVGVMPATNPSVFFVRDNGAGFDMQHADKLFGLFQRLHSAKEFPGTGVGLAGVQHIIRRHGGRVWAEARPGQGACFYFTLGEASQAATSASRITA
jgi:signal transduction histidine kinase